MNWKNLTNSFFYLFQFSILLYKMNNVIFNDGYKADNTHKEFKYRGCDVISSFLYELFMEENNQIGGI